MPVDGCWVGDDPVGMDRTLPLHPLHSLLPLDQPFTPAMARSVGISSRALSRMLSAGLVRRVLRGVYVASTARPSAALRANSVGLVLRPGDVVVDRTAAWVHGVDCLSYAELDDPPPVESCVLRGHEPTERPEVVGRTRDLRDEDIVVIGGVRVTSPLRTAADLLCLLPRREALAAADALMRAHGFTVADLRRLLVRYFRRRGVIQARDLAPLVDGRAESAGESWTRLVIIDHDLPTPQVQVWIDVDGRPTYRLDLAYAHARIAIEYDGAEHHSRRADRQRDEARRAWLRAHGWRVIVVTKLSFSDEAVSVWIGELRSMLAAA